MTDRQTPDVSALDDLIGSHTNRWYGRGCAVGRLVADLDPGPYRDRLIVYMDMPVSDLGHAPIIAAIRETLGEEVRADTLGRHRRRSCSCGPEVYS